MTKPVLYKKIYLFRIYMYGNGFKFEAYTQLPSPALNISILAFNQGCITIKYIEKCLAIQTSYFCLEPLFTSELKLFL